jgi:hypothetical protein
MNALRNLAAAAVVLAWASSAQAMDYSYRLYKGHITIDASGVIEKDEPFHLINFINTLPVDVRALLTDKKEMTRHIRWRQKPCERCGEMVTTNGLGRDAHERWCRTATPEQRAALAKRKAEEEKDKGREGGSARSA